MANPKPKPGFRTPHKFVERKKLQNEQRKASFRPAHKLTRLPFTRRGI